LECVVRGVPAITSDLSGIGRYVIENFPDHDAAVMYVARRRGVGFEATVAQVVEGLSGLTRMSRRARIALPNPSDSHPEESDGSKLVRPYHMPTEYSSRSASAGPPRPPRQKS